MNFSICDWYTRFDLVFGCIYICVLSTVKEIKELGIVMKNSHPSQMLPSNVLQSKWHPTEKYDLKSHRLVLVRRGNASCSRNSTCILSSKNDANYVFIPCRFLLFASNFSRPSSHEMTYTERSLGSIYICLRETNLSSRRSTFKYSIYGW